MQCWSLTCGRVLAVLPVSPYSFCKFATTLHNFLAFPMQDESNNSGIAICSLREKKFEISMKQKQRGIQRERTCAKSHRGKGHALICDCATQNFLSLFEPSLLSKDAPSSC